MSAVPQLCRAFRFVAGRLVIAGLLTGTVALHPLHAQELDPGVNTASVIDFPTALDQHTPNVVHGSVSLVDVATPDLRPVNLGVGHQIGNFQLLADAYWLTEPAKAFDYGEVKGKLRIVSFDPERTYIALGAIARWTDQPGKDKEAIDDKPYSLLAVVTTELFPFDQWGAFLLNFYIDNRYFDTGLKVQLVDTVKFVSEVDYHFGDVNNNPNEWRTKAGLEFTSEQNLYFQLLYDDAQKHARVQLGWGF